MMMPRLIDADALDGAGSPPPQNLAILRGADFYRLLSGFL